MSNEELLVIAKQRFSDAILRDAMLVRLVANKLSSEGHRFDDVRLLPDFMVEPWHPIDPNTNLANFGLSLVWRTVSQSPGRGFSIGVFDYLVEALVPTSEAGERTLLEFSQGVFLDASDALLECGELEELKPAAQHYVFTWQEFYQVAETLGARADPRRCIFVIE